MAVYLLGGALHLYDIWHVRLFCPSRELFGDAAATEGSEVKTRDSKLGIAFEERRETGGLGSSAGHIYENAGEDDLLRTYCKFCLLLGECHLAPCYGR